MPPKKSDIKIIIEVNGKRLSLNCQEWLFGKYRVKNGRSLSKKKPIATLTEIFEEGRRWAVANKHK
jgi:hypothetical protein